jgi:hypothetical protein
MVRAACPDTDAADKAEMRRTTSLPPHWPKAGASRREMEARIDSLEASEERKNTVGQRGQRDLSRCRGDPPPKPAMQPNT